MSNTAETLYYLIYNNVLLGKTDEAKMYLEFLRDEFNKHPNQFEPLKQDERWEHLVELGNIIDNNLVVKNFDKIEKCNELSIKQEDSTKIKNQKDLMKFICQEKTQLKTLINADDDFNFIDAEQQTLFGRVDLVAQDKNTIYPIELKTSIADHSVIGQIEKYVVHYKLRLMNKIYKHVKGIVISNNFLEYVLQQLPQIGVIAILYTLKNDKIELKRA
jgi:RecB family endonuclease NucS